MRWVRGTMAVAVCFLAVPSVVAAQAPALDGFAFVDIQRIATESNEGQAANTRVDEVSEQKLAEIEAVNTEGQGQLTSLNQELQEAQLKLQQGLNVLSADATASLQREIVRLQRDLERTSQDTQAEIQRMTQDAEAEVQELQQQLQLEFQRRLLPAIDKLAADKQLSFIFNAQQGLVWADTSLDLTQEVIDVLNSEQEPAP
jgi:Skp family chaperone for outer membrane proteins